MTVTHPFLFQMHVIIAKELNNADKAVPVLN
jgi:hypothetical protein